MKDFFLFSKRFLKNPAMVASIIPTSRKGVETICSGIRSDVKQTVVEYGAGEGAITRRLLEPGVLSPDSKVIAIELDKPLADHLQASLHDPRVRVFHDSAENVRDILRECGETQADIVISGIPFSRMSKEVCVSIAEETHHALADHGRFVVYQVTDAVRRYIKGRFEIHERGHIWFNVPPLLVYRASKNGKA